MTCFDEEPDGDIHGECAAEIHRLQSQVDRLMAELATMTAGKVTLVKEKFYPADKELIEQLQADNARLREILQSTVSTLQEYASSNPKHYYRKVLQDPNGVHAALAIVNEALASTDSSNWLAEQKAQWRREVLLAASDALKRSVEWDQKEHRWLSDWERVRRMAEQSESKSSDCARNLGL